jgi:hypothetical protein
MANNILSDTNVTNLTLDRTANAGAAEAVRGNDTRLSDKRNPVDAVASITLAATNYDNYDPGADYQVLLITLTGSGGRSLTGLARGSATNNRVLLVVVDDGTSGWLNIPHESASSSAGNRFLIRDGTTLALYENDMIQLEYDSVASRWRQVPPSGHKTTHQAGGSDAIKLDDLTTPDDNTDLNASNSRHGLVLKAVAPAAGIRNVLAIDNGETVYKNTALLDNTNPENVGTAAPGTSLIAARRDHVHGGGGGGGSSWLMCQVFS